LFSSFNKLIELINVTEKSHSLNQSFNRLFFLYCVFFVNNLDALSLISTVLISTYKTTKNHMFLFIFSSNNGLSCNRTNM